MLGALILVLVLVFILPSAVLISAGAGAAILGHSLVTDAEQRHEGSELVDLNT